MKTKMKYKTGGMTNPNAMAKVAPTSAKGGKGKMTMKKMGKKK